MGRGGENTGKNGTGFLLCRPMKESEAVGLEEEGSWKRGPGNGGSHKLVEAGGMGKS